MHIVRGTINLRYMYIYLGGGVPIDRTSRAIFPTGSAAGFPPPRPSAKSAAKPPPPAGEEEAAFDTLIKPVCDARLKTKNIYIYVYMRLRACFGL